MRTGWITMRIQGWVIWTLSLRIYSFGYYENSSHSLQNTKIAKLEHFICSAHNYNFIQIHTTCILYLTHFLSSNLATTNPHIGPSKSSKSCKHSLLRDSRNCESAPHHVFSVRLTVSSWLMNTWVCFCK